MLALLKPLLLGPGPGLHAPDLGVGLSLGGIGPSPRFCRSVPRRLIPGTGLVRRQCRPAGAEQQRPEARRGLHGRDSPARHRRRRRHAADRRRQRLALILTTDGITGFRRPLADHA